MPFTYTSKHHSPEDPGGIIRDVLDMGPEFAGPARDALLSWMLRLGEDIDPATAARTLLARYGLGEGAVPGGACGELVALLRETARYPQSRLGAHLCRPGSGPRRGRRRSRK